MSRPRVPFLALLASYVISVAGTAMSGIAVPWLVLTTTGSAADTGLAAFATMGPYVVAQLLAGPLVDRAGLRRSFIAGNIVAALAMGAIPACHAAGVLRLPVLFLLVAIAGAVRGAADCANNALVPATAEAGRVPLERAAGLNAGANRLAVMLGAPLAGALVTFVGPPAVVAIDAGTFAVAAVLAALWIRVPSAAAPLPAGSGAGVAMAEARTADARRAEARTADASTGEGRAGGRALRRYGRDLAAGLRFIARDRLVLGIVVMVGVTNLLDQGLSEVMLPVWVRERIGTAGALGLIAGIGGLGAVLGNALGAWLGPRLSRRAVYTVGYLAGGAPRFAVLVLAGSLYPVLAVFLVAEVFSGSLNPVIGATAYERIPEDLRARVLGAIRALAWVGIPVGGLVAGYAVTALGAGTALLAFGAAYLLTTLSPLVFPVWRQLRRPEPAAAPAPTRVPA